MIAVSNKTICKWCHPERYREQMIAIERLLTTRQELDRMQEAAFPPIPDAPQGYAILTPAEQCTRSVDAALSEAVEAYAAEFQTVFNRLSEKYEIK